MPYMPLNARNLYRNAQHKLRLLYRNIPYLINGAPDGLPIPPLKLRKLIWSDSADIGMFLGGDQAQVIFDVLNQQGVNIDDFQAILDFGCGAGRVIRHFHHLTKAKLYGTDINAEQIDWCKRNLRFAEFEINRSNPPLIYSDEQFDLIYSVSVFIHLPESQQLMWIKDLSRVLRPGGYLLITTCGEAYFERLTQEEKERFRCGQLIVRCEKLAGSPSMYAACLAFHPVTYMTDKLAKGFEVIQFVPADPSRTGPQGDMDHYLLKKPVNAFNAT